MQQSQQPHLQPQQQNPVGARGSRPDFRFPGNEAVALDDQAGSAVVQLTISFY
jgi:hypothetical protein